MADTTIAIVEDGTTVGVIEQTSTIAVGVPGMRGQQGVQGQQGAQGVQGIQGIQGEPGAGAEPSYTMPFSNTAEVTWIHNLGKYPDVLCRDDLNRPVMVVPIFDSLSTLRVQFPQPRSGVLIIPN